MTLNKCGDILIKYGIINIAIALSKKTKNF